MRRLLLLALIAACGEPSPSKSCQDARDCAPAQICQSGKCLDVAAPECTQNSDCVLPPPGASVEGARCWGGTCHYLAAAGADSMSLIEQARDAGYLSDATALLYQVYAVFGDARLPEMYQSTHALAGDAMVLASVRHQWDSLDSMTQSLLAPFLLPPAAGGSWHELRESSLSGRAWPSPDAAKIEWHTVDNAGIRIWYQTRHSGDDVKAAQLAAAAAAPILGKLDETMATRWLSDEGQANNGGDGRLDVYLVRDLDVYGLTTPYRDCQKSPVWIILDSGEPIGDEHTPGLVQTLAHEWLHAVQLGMAYKNDCRQYMWMMEMTATWFEDAVYPLANSEKIFAQSYLDTAYWPIDGTTSARWYGAYLWPFFLTRVHTFPNSLIGAMFRSAATEDPLDAVDADGRFDLYWDEFVVANWNRAPFDDYQQKDKLALGITPFGASIPITPNLRQKLPMQLQHTSAMYYDLVIDDDNVRAIHFYDGLHSILREESGGLMGDDVRIEGEALEYDQTHALSVQALVKVAGQDWKKEDWSFGTAFCRDQKAQKLEEVILIIGNGEIKKDAKNWLLKEEGLPMQILTSDIGCWHWEGTMTRTLHLDHGTDQLTANVVWELTDPDELWSYQSFKLVGGSLQYHYDSTNPDTGCQAAADASFALGVGEDDSFLSTASGIVGGGRERSYHGYAKSHHEFEVHGGCPDPDLGWVTFTDNTELGLWWSTRGWLPHQSEAGGPLPVFADGSHMDGEFVDGNATYTWHLQAVPQK